MKPDTTSGANASATRVLRVLKALRGHTFHGLSNQELMQVTGESAVNVSRAMTTLVQEGLAMRYENGRYAPGIAILQFAQAHANEVLRMEARIKETNQRIAAGSL